MFSAPRTPARIAPSPDHPPTGSLPLDASGSTNRASYMPTCWPASPSRLFGERVGRYAQVVLSTSAGGQAGETRSVRQLCFLPVSRRDPANRAWMYSPAANSLASPTCCSSVRSLLLILPWYQAVAAKDGRSVANDASPLRHPWPGQQDHAVQREGVHAAGAERTAGRQFGHHGGANRLP